MLLKYFSVAATLLSLPFSTSAAPSKNLQRRDGSYCPGYEVSDADRLALFNAFNAELFDAANADDASEIATAFATYVSPDLIEHTAAADSYNAAVGFLTILLPGVTASLVGGLSGCFYSTKGEPICTIHYAATPDSADSLIPNVTAISDFYRYNGSCIVEHWDTTYIANANTTNPSFPGPA
jgi:predicted SnoaL-like aldol condensation-catalyzing enzyme